MMLALCLVLPFLTGQIPEIGNMLCPMHLPVLLCGFLCGPWFGGAVGFVAPLLRWALFSMPPMPMGIAMMFELAAYGVFAALLYRAFADRKEGFRLYGALIGAMLLGRIVWGIARWVLLGAVHLEFSLAIFVTSGFLQAIPGILAQLILIPAIVYALRRAKFLQV